MSSYADFFQLQNRSQNEDTQLVGNTHQLCAGAEGRGKRRSVQSCCHQHRQREPLWKNRMTCRSRTTPVVRLKSRGNQTQETRPTLSPWVTTSTSVQAHKGKYQTCDKWVEETVIWVRGVLLYAEGLKPRQGMGALCCSPLCLRTALFECRSGTGCVESRREMREWSAFSGFQGTETLS